MSTGAREAARTEQVLSPRKVKRRAEQLVREATLLLKKKGKKVDEAARTETRARLDDTTAKIPTRKNKIALDAKGLERATTDLDQALAKHFLKWRKSPLRELLEAIAWAVGLAFVIRFFLLEAFSIPSSSMYPTLEIGDHLFINKIGYGVYLPFSTKRIVSWTQPDHGDVIVFEYNFPGDPLDGEDFIKRVIGLPGDRVRLEGNTIILNDKPIQTEPIAKTPEAWLGDPAHIGECAIFHGGDYNDTPDGWCQCSQQRETIDGESWVTQHLDGACTRALENRNPMRTPVWPLEVSPCGPFTGVLKENGAKLAVSMPSACKTYLGARYPDESDRSTVLNADFPNVVVPEGHVFVMGDNRDQSQEGRFWGFVPFNRIKGQAFVIWWARDKGRLFNWIN